MDNVISVYKSEVIEIQTKTRRECTDLFGRGKMETIHNAIQDLRSKHNGEFDATVILEKLDSQKNWDPHWTFMSLAAMILMALAIFLIGILIWRKCCHNSNLPMPMPSAPLMPMQMPMPTTMMGPTVAPGPINRKGRDIGDDILQIKQTCKY
jgi:hypothetical protein